MMKLKFNFHTGSQAPQVGQRSGYYFDDVSQAFLLHSLTIALASSDFSLHASLWPDCLSLTYDLDSFTVQCRQARSLSHQCFCPWWPHSESTACFDWPERVAARHSDEAFVVYSYHFSFLRLLDTMLKLAVDAVWLGCRSVSTF